jgi:RND family efflux transporter MFP subunit
VLRAGLLAGLAAFLAVPLARAASFDCVIDPSQSLKIGSPITSTLEAVLVERGEFVRRGQIIARLESGVEAATMATNQARAESVAEIAVRRAKVDQASLEVARGNQLVPGNNIAGQKMDELRTNLRVAQQDLVLAEQNKRMAELEVERSRALLAQRVIRSPINGLVVQRVLGPGEYVHQDTHIAVIAAIDPLFIEAFPPVRYYGRIRVGDRATVRPDDPVGGDRSAEVTAVDRVFDTGSGTFGVRLTLANQDGLVPAGLRCRVTFDVPELPGTPEPRVSAAR